MSLIKKSMKGKEDIQSRKRKLERMEKLLEEKQERLIKRRAALEKKRIQLYEEERKEKRETMDENDYKVNENKNDDILVYNDDTTHKIIIEKTRKNDEEIAREVEKLFEEFTAIETDNDFKDKEKENFEEVEGFNEEAPNEVEFLQGKDF